MKQFSKTYYGMLRQLLGHKLMIVTGSRIVLENKDGRYLFQKRNDWNIWGFPGGVSELKESIHECALRELVEETGLKATKWEPFAFASGLETEISRYPNGDEVHCFVLLIHVTEWTGKVKNLASESDQLKFYHQNEVPDKIRECDKRAIEALIKFKETKQFQLY